MGFLRDALHGGSSKDSSSSARDRHHHDRHASPQADTSLAEHVEQATPEQVTGALQLVTEAVQELTTAAAELAKKGGASAALKTGATGAGWSEAGSTLVHDGRYSAKDLVQDASDKYEAAALLVGGLPDIEVVGIKVSKSKEKAEAIAGPFGKTAVSVAGAGASIAATVMSVAPVGLIKMAVKKRRTKKAVSGVDGMLAAYKEVRQQLEVLNQRRAGGEL